MTNEIEKLSDVEFEITDDVLNRKWYQVASKRKRLLAISDWTQLSDNNLLQPVRSVWMKWRQKVRAVKRTQFIDPDKAMQHLDNLESQIPEKISTDLPEVITHETEVTSDTIGEQKVNELKQYIDKLVTYEVIPKIISVDDVIKIVTDTVSENTNMLLRNFNEVLEKTVATKPVELPTEITAAKLKLIDMINNRCDKEIPRLNNDLVDEAIDYLSHADTAPYALLIVYAENYNKSMEDMANEIILQKKEWLKTVCKIEHKRLKYINRINQSSEYENLLSIFHEIMNGY